MTTLDIHIHETTRHGTFEEFRHDGGGDHIAVVAPHGGAVEPNTDTQALLLAQRYDDAVCWGTRGVVDGDYNDAFDTWHYTRTDYDLDDFPLFNSIQSRDFDHAVAFHAMSDDGIYVGGRAPNTAKQAVATHLQRTLSVDIQVVNDGRCAGTYTGNFVNTLASDGGIHLEQGLQTVCNNPEQIVAAIRVALDEIASPD